MVDDVDGHGTAVAGIIAARRNQALSHGVAFDARILAVRADMPGSCASGCAFDQADVATATDYAVGRGAGVINYSLGGSTSLGASLEGALARAADAGTILVFAAGNEGAADPTFPAGVRRRARGRRPGDRGRRGRFQRSAGELQQSGRHGPGPLSGRARGQRAGAGPGRRRGAGQRHLLRGAARQRRRCPGAAGGTVPERRRGGRAAARQRDRSRCSGHRSGVRPRSRQSGGGARSAGPAQRAARQRRRGGGRTARRLGAHPWAGVRRRSRSRPGDLSRRLRAALWARSRPARRERRRPARIFTDGWAKARRRGRSPCRSVQELGLAMAFSDRTDEGMLAGRAAAGFRARRRRLRPRAHRRQAGRRAAGPAGGQPRLRPAGSLRLERASIPQR